MLKSEFESRTGHRVADERYEEIERIYMNTNLTKDEFCADYKKHANSAIIEELNGKVESEKWHRAEDVHAVEERLAAAEERAALLEQLLVQSMEVVADYNTCIATIGSKRYLELKLRLGLPLGNTDKELMLGILESLK